MMYAYGVGRTAVQMRIMYCGDDFIISITGGDKPHIGAVSLAVPNCTIDSSSPSSTASVLTVYGHKEDEIARNKSLLLSKVTQKTVLVSCGIHINNATSEELRIFIKNVDKIIDNYIEDLALHQFVYV